jgi:fatty acid desaturase
MDAHLQKASPAAPADRRAEIVTAYALVRDLMRPRAYIYWIDFGLTGTAAWLTFLTAVMLPPGSAGMAVACVLAVLLSLRVGTFIHEISHKQDRHLPGFRMVWNVFVGIPMLFPSILYDGVHEEHHGRKKYGTAQDPEYLPFAGRPTLVLALILLSFVGPFHLLARFLIAAPISWLVPPYRRFLLRRASAFCFNPMYQRVLTEDQKRSMLCWELLILAAWVPCLTATALGWLPWRWLVLWYSVVSGVALINHARELVAHRYCTDGRPRSYADQLPDSLDTPGGWWTALWAPLGLRYHALHHLFPRLPYHNMAEARRRLLQHLPPGALYRQTTNSSFGHALLRLLRGNL